MVFWHIRILYEDKKSGTTSYSYDMDIGEDILRTFAKQYQDGNNVFFVGRWLDPLNFLEVLIFQTEEFSKHYETIEMTGRVAIFSEKKRYGCYKKLHSQKTQQAEKRKNNFPRYQ